MKTTQMNKLFAALLLTLPLAFTSAYAAADGTSAQNNKMKTCSADFKTTGKASSERRAFMSECLKKDSAPAKAADATSATTDKMTTQQEKMKTCNADAKTGNKKGADRKAFMKECLSK